MRLLIKQPFFCLVSSFPLLCFFSKKKKNNRIDHVDRDVQFQTFHVDLYISYVLMRHVGSLVMYYYFALDGFLLILLDTFYINACVY